ncbi:hypothetical protein LIER_08161 [Lithospermum erythrorhizon]|uniref:Uncharacterized protein n=1 Tax=Lithospermum erythrorhizon TaxID=34254 RepID=A0AAV3PAZ3_LITER
MPHKVNFKVVTTDKDPLARISKRKSVSILESSSGAPPLALASKKSRKASKKVIPKDSPVIIEVITETFNPPSPVLLPPATITISDNTPALDIVPSTLESTPIRALVVTSSEFLTPFLWATKSAHRLFLKWKESEESRVNSETEKTTLEKRLSEVLRERDEARAQAEDLRRKHEDLQAICNGLLKSKSDLSSRPPPEVVIERFEEGQNFADLLIDNTVSIMKTFNLKVYEEFPSVQSMFPEFVGEHFGKEYVVPLTDGEEESDDDVDDAQSDDGLGEDEDQACSL